MYKRFLKYIILNESYFMTVLWVDFNVRIENSFMVLLVCDFTRDKIVITVLARLLPHKICA